MNGDKEIDAIEVKKHADVIQLMDYIVVSGSVFQVKVNGYNGDVFLKRVEEIPEAYFGRWEEP